MMLAMASHTSFLFGKDGNYLEQRREAQIWSEEPKRWGIFRTKEASNQRAQYNKRPTVQGSCHCRVKWRQAYPCLQRGCFRVSKWWRSSQNQNGATLPLHRGLLSYYIEYKIGYGPRKEKNWLGIIQRILCFSYLLLIKFLEQ